MKSQMAACRLAARRHGRAVRQIRPRHHPGRDRTDLRRDRAEVPQRGGAAPRRRLRGRAPRSTTTACSRASRCRSTSRSPFNGGDMTIDLRGCSAERKAAINSRTLCGRPRRLQGADRPARPGQRRLVPRAQGHHPGRQHHDGALPGADGGLELDRADGGRHHRQGAGRRRCRTGCRRATTACSAARWCSSACIPRPSGASWCRASRAAAGAAGRTRTASRHGVGVPGRRAQRLDRGHRAEMPGAGGKPRAAAGLLRRRQVPRRARHRHAGAQPGRRPLEFRACRAAASARPGACGAARRANRAAICCGYRAKATSSHGRQPHSGADRRGGDRAHRRRRRLGRSAASATPRWSPRTWRRG